MTIQTRSKNRTGRKVGENTIFPDILDGTVIERVPLTQLLGNSHKQGISEYFATAMSEHFANSGRPYVSTVWENVFDVSCLKSDQEEADVKKHQEQPPHNLLLKMTGCYRLLPQNYVKRILTP
jgi:hypothetical protein